MQKRLYLLAGLALYGLVACRTNTILRSASQETAFRKQYIGKPFYTAMVLRPYQYDEEYLVDLTGKIAANAYETPRVRATIPLGTPITITEIDRKYILARIKGSARIFRVMVPTKRGALDDVEKDLTLLLSSGPPLQSVRTTVRTFIAQQEVARGMSRREVFMSWGQPDKVTGSPSSSGYLEEWIYFDRRMHLFLENGFVTNWQQF